MTRPQGQTGPIARAVMDDVCAEDAPGDYAGDCWYWHLPDDTDAPAHPQSFRGDKYLHSGRPDVADFNRILWDINEGKAPRARAEIASWMVDLWESPLTRIERAALAGATR